MEFLPECSDNVLKLYKTVNILKLSELYTFKMGDLCGMWIILSIAIVKEKKKKIKAALLRGKTLGIQQKNFWIINSVHSQRAPNQPSHFRESLRGKIINTTAKETDWQSPYANHVHVIYKYVEVNTDEQTFKENLIRGF